MKKLFKMLNVLFVAVLAVGTLIPYVSAETGTFEGTTGTITVTAQEGKDPIKDGEVYNAYRILDLESYDDVKGAYVYKANSDWETFVNSTGIKGVYLNVDNQGYVTWVEGADAAEFAKLAYTYAKANKIAPIDTATAENGSAVFEGEKIKLGYYLVDSSLGVICSLDTAAKDVIIKEKNQKPDVLKKQDGTKDPISKNIGDSVKYTIYANNIGGLKNVRITDKLSEGLTLTYSVDELTGKHNGITVKNGNTVLVEGTDYTITSIGTNGFVIKLEDSYTENLPKDTTIIVEYSAVINEKAIVGKPNTNEVDLDYGNGTHVDGNETITYTYGFKFHKVDEENESLDGAEFELYDALTGGNKIPVVLVKTENGINYYRVAKTGETGVKMVAGRVVVDGLAAGTYYLEETKAPDGYNKLGSRIEITITEDGETFTYPDKPVVNTTGAQLPSTGGMGTVLFITIGSLMVAGFGIMLITKFRMSKFNA